MMTPTEALKAIKAIYDQVDFSTPIPLDPRYSEAVDKGLMWTMTWLRQMGNGALPDWWTWDAYNAAVKAGGDKPFRSPPEWQGNLYGGPQSGSPGTELVDRSGADLGLGPNPKIFEGRAGESKHYSLSASRSMLVKTGRAQSSLGACNHVRVRVDAEVQEAIADASTTASVSPGPHTIEVTLLEDGAVTVEAT